MPNLTADQIVTQKHKRNFIQFGGARPGNPVAYAGQDAQYLAIQGVGLPESGGVDPISRRRFWTLIDQLAASGITVLVTTLPLVSQLVFQLSRHIPASMREKAYSTGEAKNGVSVCGISPS